jgi:hypothetical protein
MIETHLKVVRSWLHLAQSDIGDERSVAMPRADWESVAAVLAEVDRLRARVTELQTLGSKMVYERQQANRYGGRDARQQIVFGWVSRVFGSKIAHSVIERATRVREEAVEVAQAAGVPRDAAVAVLRRCYDREVGDVRSEVANLSVTLLALCGTLKVSAEELERNEIERILAIPEEDMRARQSRKHADGIGIAPTPPSTVVE